jgi:hypothetical protein
VDVQDPGVMCVLTTTSVIQRVLVDLVGRATAVTILTCLVPVTVIFELVNVSNASLTQRALTVRYAKLDITGML